MCGFDPGTSDCEAFEYISLARASLAGAMDKVTLYFGAATVTLRFRGETRAKRDNRERLEFYRAILRHNISWVQMGGDLIAQIEIEIKPEEELAGMEPPEEVDEET